VLNRPANNMPIEKAGGGGGKKREGRQGKKVRTSFWARGGGGGGKPKVAPQLAKIQDRKKEEGGVRVRRGGPPIFPRFPPRRKKGG